MSLEAKLIKGSRWIINTAFKLHGVTIPAGTMVEVVYQHHRQAEYFAVLSDNAEINSALKAKRIKGGKYPKASMSIHLSRFTDATELHTPDTYQYFIRLRGTDKLWGNGNHTFSGFEPRDFTSSSAIAYTTRNYAMRGIVHIIKNKLFRDKLTPESFEIISRHTITGEQFKVDIPIINIENVFRIWKQSDIIKKEFGRKTAEFISLRAIVAEEAHRWTHVGLFKKHLVSERYGSIYLKSLMNNKLFADNFMLFHNPSGILLTSERDAVLLKIALGGDFQYLAI